MFSWSSTARRFDRSLNVPNQGVSLDLLVRSLRWPTIRVWDNHHILNLQTLNFDFFNLKLDKLSFELMICAIESMTKA